LGEIKLCGENIKSYSVRKKREKGIAYIPEDRHKFGLFLPFAIDENSVIGRHHKPPFVMIYQIINKLAIRDFAKEIISRFDIRTSSEKKIALTLSGGNQQKVIVAREISSNPKLLIASQPTRGVDIGASEFIHNQLVKVRNEGKAILLVSADLDEVISLSDRIGVIYKGKIIQEFSRENAVKEKIGFFMMGEKNEITS
jgi:general nucleoside transport system ATP-binding protein